MASHRYPTIAEQEAYIWTDWLAHPAEQRVTENDAWNFAASEMYKHTLKHPNPEKRIALYIINRQAGMNEPLIERTS